MKVNKIEKAKKQCEAFLEAYDALYKREDKFSKWDLHNPEYNPCKETATLRHRSMDLTNALADMRKPN